MHDRVLKHIEAVLSAGSITMAARKLFISQPSLSQYIRRLEAEYGFTLFDRTRSPIVLTPEGEVFVRAEREIAAIDRQRRRYFRDLEDLEAGSIVIGSTQYRTETLLARVLPAFKKKHPKIRIRIIENSTGNLAAQAAAGETDFALVVEPYVGEMHSSALVYQERVLLGVPAGHPLAPPPGEIPLMEDFARFRDEEFIVMKPGQAFRRYFFELCRSAGFEPKIALESDSITTVPPLLEAGFGVALIPDTLMKMGRTGSVAFYRFGEEMPVNRVHAVWRRSGYLSKAAGLLIEEMKQCQSWSPGAAAGRDVQE